VSEHLIRRGYTPGSGNVNQDHTKFMVNIPKNASSYYSSWLNANGWSAANINNLNAERINELIIILRDPLDRWVSGFAQYALSWILNASSFFNIKFGPGPNFQRKTGEDFVNNYTWLTERLIFDNLESFDDHVYPQYKFVEELLPNTPRVYFYIGDSNVDNKVSDHLKLSFVSEGQLDRNDSNLNQDSKIIKNFLYSRINEQPELKQRILDAYSMDYNLIAQVIK